MPDRRLQTALSTHLHSTDVSATGLFWGDFGDGEFPPLVRDPARVQEMLEHPGENAT